MRVGTAYSALHKACGEVVVVADFFFIVGSLTWVIITFRRRPVTRTRVSRPSFIIILYTIQKQCRHRN